MSGSEIPIEIIALIIYIMINWIILFFPKKMVGLFS